MNKILLTISMLIALVTITSGQDTQYNYYFVSTEYIAYQQKVEHKILVKSEFIIEDNQIYCNNKLIKHADIIEGYYKDYLILTTQVIDEPFKWLALTVSQKGEILCVQFHKNEIVIEPSKRDFIMFK